MAFAGPRIYTSPRVRLTAGWDNLKQNDTVTKNPLTPTPKLITIEAGPHSLRAALNDTDTAGKIFALLPLEAVGNTWGDEIYFGVGIDAALEDGQAIVQVGDLGFWPTGNVF